ncbi:MAG: Rrf2 family transcriptional regulator [Treponema sp.]|jgi:Rrf2 family iron-sulfur cluster assembly transcriptional regulator|nr:Rrf2 family transcriptional regulator [Treponema sp.]
MRITTRGRYALRASLALAKMGKDGAPVSINHLSEQEHISSVFLEQIFFKLRKAGIVSSVRGPGGGFYFAQPLDKLTIKAILDAAGEDLESISCDKHQETCDRIGDCPSHWVWTDVTSLVNDFFKNVTLASILEKDSLQEKAEAEPSGREQDSVDNREVPESFSKTPGPGD